MSTKNLRKVDTVEITAARLRAMATELLQQADALEASTTAPAASNPSPVVFTNPITGKRQKIKRVDL